MSSARDLIAHLVPCPIEVDFSDTTYTIPAMDALGWLRLLTDPDTALYDIFPGLAGIDAVEHVEDVLWESGEGDLDQVAYDVISAAADRPWWVALRLIHAATSVWDRVHVNQVAGMSFAGWLDQIFTNITGNIHDQKKLMSWLAELESPPRGQEKQVDFDAEEAAFLAAMKAVAR